MTANGPLEVLSFSHVCVGVSDIERSLDFYRRVLGMDVVFDVELEGASLEEVTRGAGSKGRMVGGLDGEGFWSVATHAAVQEVLKDPVTYSSERGGERPYGGTLLQDLPVAGVVLNMMDDPRHARIRRLVTKGLTPRTVARLEDELRARTQRLLEAVPDGEPIDFLVDVAAELPMQMICILLGVPEEDR